MGGENRAETWHALLFHAISSRGSDIAFAGAPWLGQLGGRGSALLGAWLGCASCGATAWLACTSRERPFRIVPLVPHKAGAQLPRAGCCRQRAAPPVMGSGAAARAGASHPSSATSHPIASPAELHVLTEGPVPAPAAVLCPPPRSYATKEEWEWDWYPPWASGAGYVISKDLAVEIASGTRCASHAELHMLRRWAWPQSRWWAAPAGGAEQPLCCRGGAQLLWARGGALRAYDSDHHLEAAGRASQQQAVLCVAGPQLLPAGILHGSAPGAAACGGQYKQAPGPG